MLLNSTTCLYFWPFVISFFFSFFGAFLLLLSLLSHLVGLFSFCVVLSFYLLSESSTRPPSQQQQKKKSTLNPIIKYFYKDIILKIGRRMQRYQKCWTAPRLFFTFFSFHSIYIILFPLKWWTRKKQNTFFYLNAYDERRYIEISPFEFGWLIIETVKKR